MNEVEKIIRSRHSVRKYLRKEIEENKIEELNSLIEKCNMESGLNIQLVLDNSDVFDKFILHYGRIQNAKSYVAMIGNKSDEFLDEKIGYYGEKVVLKAQELELNTCWVAGTFNSKYVKAEIKNEEKLLCVIAIGYGENQGSMHKSKTFEDVSVSADVPEWYKKGVEFALLAPTAINEQKFKFELLEENQVKLTAPKGKMTKIDLGIVKYHFELGAGLENFKWNGFKLERKEMTMSKVLITYFSASGVTKKVAEKVASAINGDLFEIEPVEKYTSKDLNWMNKSSRSSIEMKENIKPEILNKVTNLKDYDTICLAFPIWWYKEPTIIDKFLEENDLSNKNIYVFVTSGSSSIDSTYKSLKNNFPNLNFVSGKRFTGKESNEDYINWIK